MTAMSKLSKRHMPFGPAALVTGASDGIGAATAKALAAKGFSLVVVARRQQKLDDLANEIRSDFGVAVDTFAADLGQEEGVEAVIEQTEGRDIGVAVLAAGFGTTGALTDVDYDVLP